MNALYAERFTTDAWHIIASKASPQFNLSGSLLLLMELGESYSRLDRSLRIDATCKGYPFIVSSPVHDTHSSIFAECLCQRGAMAKSHNVAMKNS